MYEPTEHDKDFLLSVIQLLKHNGEWIWPSSGAVYRVDKKKKVFTLLAGPVDNNYERQKAVATAIGWKCQTISEVAERN